MATWLCQWHTTGVPVWWTGPFFVATCPKCKAKADKDPGLREAPAPPSLSQQRHKREKFIDWDKVRAVKARRASMGIT
jgi:hypothetical protein